MAAVPYAGTLRCEQLGPNGRPTGRRVGFRFSASDVAGEAITFDDLQDRSGLVVPGGGLRVVDMTLKDVGEDTDTLQLRKGVADEPIYLDQSLLANTTTDRATRLQDLLGAKLTPGNEYTFIQR